MTNKNETDMGEAKKTKQTRRDAKLGQLENRKSTFERQKEKVIENETNEKKSLIRINAGQENNKKEKEKKDSLPTRDS